MSANWKKVLFEGSDISVASIASSQIPSTASTADDLKVLSVDSTGKFGFVEQGSLNSIQGETTGSISGSDGTSITDFDFSNDKLIFTTSNPDYFSTKLTTDTGETTITFLPKKSTFNGSFDYTTSPSQLGYISGSGQLNLISGSSVDDFAADINVFTNTYPNALAGDFVGEFLPSSVISFPTTRTYGNFTFDGGGILGNIKAHKDAADHQEKHVSQSGIGSATGNSIWGTDTTFAVGGTEGDEDTFVAGGIESTPDPVAQAGRRPGTHTYYWLSASYEGGFADNTPSLSASFSTITGSIHTISESIVDFIASQSNLNNFTGSDAGGALLSSETGGFALTSDNNFVSKEVNSIENGNINVPQLTFQGNGHLGRQIRLGRPTTDPELQQIDATLHDLTIAGTWTADEYDIPSLEFQEIKIQKVNGGVNFGTSSLHSHQFHGNTFITGGGIRIDGPVIIKDELPLENGFANVLVIDDNDGILKKQAIGVSANNTLKNSIADLVDPISQSFADRLNIIRTALGSDATADATEIGFLQSGYDVLTGSYAQGILFATASTLSEAQNNNVEGNNLGLLNTASFEVGQLASQTGNTEKILTASFSNNAITYHLNTASFVKVTGIYTGSSEIEEDVAGLNRYGKHSDLILTESVAGDDNHIDNLTYIAGLARSGNPGPGPDLVGSDANTRFLTGSGDFADFSGGTFVNDANDSTTQGVIEFSFDTDGDGSGTGVYKFGATASKMATDGQPTFNQLTLNGDLRVDGTLTNVNVTNLNIKDQFVMINSGALGTNVDNDQDGGIIVDGSGGSGSLLIYDRSAQAWGIKGSTNVASDEVSYNAVSQQDDPIVPDVYIRAIVYDNGYPPISSASLYGRASSDTNLGTMYVDTTENSEDVYIYA